MKRCYRLGMSVLLVSGVLVCRSVAQDAVPNGGFESWSSGNPTGWLTDNAVGFYTPITQSATAHSGSSALQGQAVTFATAVIGPLASVGFHVTQRDASLTGYYQFAPQSGDGLTVAVGMGRLGSGLGGGEFSTTSAASSYTQFSVPIQYSPGSGTPDTCYIILLITGPSSGAAHAGSAMLIDDLAFSGVNGVSDQSREPVVYALHQNYPNPFNPSTVISYSVAADVHVNLSVFNLLGEKVATLVDGAVRAGSHSVKFDAAHVPSGMYVYRLTAGDFVQTKTMTLLK